MSYDLGRPVLLYTRKPGSVPEPYSGDDARERYDQIRTTGKLTIRHWEYDDPEKHYETFDVDMAALCIIGAMARPGVDRGAGRPVGTWTP